MKKRLTAMLLVVCMLFTFMPMTAFAAGGHAIGERIVSSEANLPTDIPKNTEWVRENENDTGTEVLVCDNPDHTDTGHTADCYSDNLICGHDEGHNPSCYDKTGEWIECSKQNCPHYHEEEGLFDTYYVHDAKLGDDCWNIAVMKATRLTCLAAKAVRELRGLDTAYLDAQIKWMEDVLKSYKNPRDFVHYVPADGAKPICGHGKDHTQDCYELTCEKDHAHNSSCYETRYTWVLQSTETPDPTNLKDRVLELVGGDTYDFNVYYRYDGKLPADEDAVTTKGEPGTFGPSGNDTPLVTVTVDLKRLFADEHFDELAKISIKESSNWFYIYSAKYNGSTAPSEIAEIDDFWALIEKHMTSGKSELESKSDGKFVGYVLKCENEGGHLDGVLKVLPPVYSAEMYGPDGKLLKVEFVSGKNVEGKTTPTNGGVEWSSVEAVFENYLKKKYHAEKISFSEDGTEGTFVADGYRYSFAITSYTRSEKNVQYIKGYEEIAQTVDEKRSVVGYLAQFKISEPTPVTGKLTISKTVTGVSVDALPVSFEITATHKDDPSDVYKFTKTDITSGKTFTNVKPGTYMLAETGADVDHYALRSDLPAEVTVTAGQEARVEAVNTYTRSDYDYKFVNGEAEVASGTKDMDVAIGAAPADPELSDGQRFDGWFEKTTDKQFDPKKAYNKDVVFEARFTDVVKVTKELTTIQDTYHVGDEVSFKITVEILEGTTEPLTITEIPGTGLINGKLTGDDIFTIPIVNVSGVRLGTGWDVRYAKVEINGAIATVTPVAGGSFKKGDTITFNYTVNLGMPGSDANIFGGNQTCNKVDATLDGATSTATTDPINKVNQPKIDVDVEKKVTKINGKPYGESNKTAGKGDTVTYEITVKNTGSVPVFGVPVLDLTRGYLTDGKFDVPSSTLDLSNIDISSIKDLLKGQSTVNLALGKHVNIVLTADWKNVDTVELIRTLSDIKNSQDLKGLLSVLEGLITKPDTSASSIQEAIKNIEEYISALLKKYKFLDMNIYVDGKNADAVIIGRLDAGETVTLTYQATVQCCDEEGKIKNLAIVGCEKSEAVIDAARVTVTYTDGVDGKVFTDQKYTVLKGAATPAFKGTLTREGYDFTGWKNDVADDDTIYTDAEIAKLTVDNDIIYTAQWAEKHYPVYFYIEDLDNDSYVLNGIPGNDPLTVEKGYVFVDHKSTTADGKTDGAEGDANVVAWLKNVDVSVNFKSSDLVAAAVEKNSGLEDVQFSGWRYHNAAWVEEDHAWHVHIELTHLVTYIDGVENETVMPDQYKTVAHGEKTPVLSFDPSRTDYKFMGWKSSLDNKVYTTAQIAELDVVNNVTYTAQWAAFVTPIEPKAVAYKVEHYKENADGTYTLADFEFPLYGEIGETVTATPKSYERFALDTAAEGTKQSGEIVDPLIRDDNSGKITGIDESKILVLKLYYSPDKIGEGTGEKTEKPDGIPDKYQVTVKYTSERGGEITGLEKEVITLKDANGKYLTQGDVEASGSEVERTSSKYRFDEWTGDWTNKSLGDDEELEPFTIKDAKGGETYIVTAEFNKKKSSGGSGGKVEIKEPEVPQGLNGDDHFQYIFGYDDGTVRPLAKITRAEIAAIFYRLLDDETREYYFTTENDFPDMKDTMWYNKAVSTLANAGIITGCSDGLFHGGRNITRAELATIIAKFDMITYEGEDIFSDISGHWAREYINSSADKGWIVGDGTGKFRPYDDITRAEVMTMINAVLNRAVDEDGLCKGYKKWPDNTKGTWYYYQVIEATNYHDYEREADLSEIWTEILPDKTWDEAGR